MEKIIRELKESLHDALFLDLDDFGLEIEGGEVISRFVGLKLHSAFQPIYSAGKSSKLVGYEALLRPAIGPDALSPPLAFDFADKQGRLVKLDRVARTLHMLNYLHLPQNPGLLFLNVHPKLLTSVNAHGKVFERVLHTHSLPTHQVVVEIQESAVEIDKHLAEAVGNYRDRGYRIAIDGLGGKHTNLKRLWQHPLDYVKLDAGLVREAETNAKARATLSKLVEIVQAVGAQPIIQGIENETQHQIALEAGSSLLQGYHLGRPASSAEWLARKPEGEVKAAA
jgi:EAL domain-containing protein (putative c-di-GMP-specific phosphodiesterase class I)